MRVLIGAGLIAFMIFGLGCVEDNPGAEAGADAMAAPDASPAADDARAGERDAPDSALLLDAMAPPDGMAPDGMAPDGMAPDGMAPDGMAPDGMAPDGMRPDSMAPDGMAPDAALPPPDAAPPGAELCDGEDQDGDGRIDEGLGLGAPCAVGLGACAAPGQVECVAGRATCVGEAGQPSDEVCNGTDDDCDGIVDESEGEVGCYPGSEGEIGRGPCAEGVRQCVAGTPACVGVVLPEPEACDGMDRDCDGRVDEGCAACGDGALDFGEACDDGNQLAGDGCAANCTLEGEGLVPGIQRDLAFETIAARGWQPCHSSNYNEGGAPLDDVLADCAGSHLLIGCAPVNGDALTVAAEGAFDQVTADVGGGAGAVNPHNGVDFYFSRAASWGFAPPGAGVNRNTCDVQDQESPDRMCWHTADAAFRGGWRCGATVRLNNSGDWRRWIFTRRRVALGADRGFGHHGQCGDFNGCVDAAGCARAACAFFDQGPPLSWSEGRCEEGGGFDCDLFERGGRLDTEWAPGCAMPMVHDVVCEGGARFVCGDGRLDPGEACDDGGQAPGDGCSPDCRVERPLEGFVGPRTGVAVGDLVAGGFELCHTELYSARFDLETTREACPGDEWVVGCRPVGEEALLTVAAVGEYAVFSAPTERAANAARDHNGARWYYTDEFSFGYAPAGAPLNRNTCDTNNVEAERRLCWHTHDLGGWRCGATTGLNNSDAWQRVVLHR